MRLGFFISHPFVTAMPVDLKLDLSKGILFELSRDLVSVCHSATSSSLIVF